MDSSHPILAHLREIWTTADRSTNLTRQLLAFARKQTVAPRVLEEKPFSMPDLAAKVRQVLEAA